MKPSHLPVWIGSLHSGDEQPMCRIHRTAFRFETTIKHVAYVSIMAVALHLMVYHAAFAQTFSVENTSVDFLSTLLNGDDILVPGGLPVGTIPTVAIPGLAAGGGAAVEVNGFSYGRQFQWEPGTSVILFSVDAFSVGVSGSDVFIESSAGAGEQNYDVYHTDLLNGSGTNTQIHDGDGLSAGGTGTTSPLGIFEPQQAPGDVIHPGTDGYDIQRDPGALIYWTWQAGAEPVPPSGVSGADVMVSTVAPGYDGAGTVFANSTALGLDATGLNADNIDALEVFDYPPVGTFDEGSDIILFSLEPGSTSLTALGFSPGDILISSGGGTPPGLAVAAPSLGLVPADNVTALTALPEGWLAVELSSFSATHLDGDVFLEWVTAGEENNAGFEIQHKSGSEFRDLSSGWEILDFIEGRGTTAESRSYSYTVAGLDPGKHAFRLNQIDFAGTSSLSTVVEVTVAVPDRYVMKAAYPNPFNPSTTIRYAVATDQQVAASLHDVLGREVRSLGVLSVGANEMHDLRVDATGLQTGIYIVRLSGETFSASQRVLFLK